MKLLIKKTDYEEVEVNLPFYANVQGETSETYVRIDENSLTEITHHLFGKVEIYQNKRPSTYIAKCWYDNPTTKEVWDEVYNNTKEYINQLK